MPNNYITLRSNDVDVEVERLLGGDGFLVVGQLPSTLFLGLGVDLADVERGLALRLRGTILFLKIDARKNIVEGDVNSTFRDITESFERVGDDELLRRRDNDGEDLNRAILAVGAQNLRAEVYTKKMRRLTSLKNKKYYP